MTLKHLEWSKYAVQGNTIRQQPDAVDAYEAQAEYHQHFFSIIRMLNCP